LSGILGLIKLRDWLIAEIPYLVALQTSSIFMITLMSCHDLSVHITLLHLFMGNSDDTTNTDNDSH
jgi:hypothetical protein